VIASKRDAITRREKTDAMILAALLRLNHERAAGASPAANANGQDNARKPRASASATAKPKGRADRSAAAPRRTTKPATTSRAEKRAPADRARKTPPKAGRKRREREIKVMLGVTPLGFRPLTIEEIAAMYPPAPDCSLLAQRRRVPKETPCWRQRERRVLADAVARLKREKRYDEARFYAVK